MNCVAERTTPPAHWRSGVHCVLARWRWPGPNALHSVLPRILRLTLKPKARVNASCGSPGGRLGGKPNGQWPNGPALGRVTRYRRRASGFMHSAESGRTLRALVVARHARPSQLARTMALAHRVTTWNALARRAGPSSRSQFPENRG